MRLPTENLWEAPGGAVCVSVLNAALMATSKSTCYEATAKATEKGHTSFTEPSGIWTPTLLRDMQDPHYRAPPPSTNTSNVPKDYSRHSPPRILLGTCLLKQHLPYLFLTPIGHSG